MKKKKNVPKDQLSAPRLDTGVSINRYAEFSNTQEDSMIEALDMALDTKVSEILAESRVPVPSGLENRVFLAMLAEQGKNQPERGGRTRTSWFTLPAFATALAVFVILLIMVPLQDYNPLAPNPAETMTTPPVPASNQSEKEIAEIKTEWVLTDSNIKIIWVQKKDFKIN